MKYEMLQELTGGKTFKTISDFKRYNARDLATIMFLYLLAIQIMRKSFYKKPFTTKYAEQILSTNSNGYNNVSNDFALLLYFFLADDNESLVRVLKDNEESRLLINSVDITDALLAASIQEDEEHTLEGYLNRLHDGEDDNHLDSIFIYIMGQELGIEESNYNSLRILIVEWDTETHEQKQLTATRLLQALRHRLPAQDEIRKNFEEWALKEKMEVDVYRNAETGKRNQKGVFISTLVGVLLGAISAAGTKK